MQRRDLLNSLDASTELDVHGRRHAGELLVRLGQFRPPPDRLHEKKIGFHVHHVSANSFVHLRGTTAWMEINMSPSPGRVLEYHVITSSWLLEGGLDMAVRFFAGRIAVARIYSQLMRALGVPPPELLRSFFPRKLLCRIVKATLSFGAEGELSALFAGVHLSPEARTDDEFQRMEAKLQWLQGAHVYLRSGPGVDAVQRRERCSCKVEGELDLQKHYAAHQVNSHAKTRLAVA